MSKADGKLNFVPLLLLSYGPLYTFRIACGPFELFLQSLRPTSHALLQAKSLSWTRQVSVSVHRLSVTVPILIGHLSQLNCWKGVDHDLLSELRQLTQSDNEYM